MLTTSIIKRHQRTLKYTFIRFIKYKTKNGNNYEKKVLTVMVNNATSINKTNNYFSPPIIECKKDYIPLEILDLALDRHANVAV